MTREYIQKKAVKLVRKYKTRDPILLAEQIGLQLRYADLGSLCGFYNVILRNRFIVLNQNLNDPLRQIVAAHEIGHDQLHRSFLKNDMIFSESLYDMTSIPEFEANLFAATLLIEEGTIHSLLQTSQSVKQIAQKLDISPHLVAIYLGMADYRSDFLKTQEF